MARCCKIFVTLTVTTCVVGFSSCALISNGKRQQIQILSTPEVRLVNYDTSVVVGKATRGYYTTMRSSKPLLLGFLAPDSTVHKLKVKSRLSPAFIFGNWLTPFAAGYITDLFFKNKYRYPPKNYVTWDTARDRILYARVLPGATGNLRFSLGWSAINRYNHFSPNLEHIGSPFGLNLHLEYFFKPQHTLLVEAGLGTIGNTEPYRGKRRYYPKKDDIFIRTNISGAWFLTCYRFHHNKIVYGAGLSVSPIKVAKHHYKILREDSVLNRLNDTVILLKEHPASFFMTGVNFNLEYRVTDYFSPGINWQLYLFDFNGGYSDRPLHYVNVYLMFKVTSWKSKKKKAEYEGY